MVMVQSAVVVVHVLVGGQPKLLQIGQTSRAAGVFADVLEDRKQDGGKNRDNGDDNEQLDKCKCLGGGPAAGSRGHGLFF